MPNPEMPPTPEELSRQARQHLDSLRAAGVEWLPTAPLPAPVVPVQPPARPAPAVSQPAAVAAEPVPAAVEAVSLFAADENPAAALTLEQRRQALAVLAEEVSHCTRCPELTISRTQTVFADGGPGVELCLVGEAPGADEDAQGLPFVGAAGQLLNKILAACGLKREDVFICNTIKCRPPRNRTPQPQEAANCREYLEKQIELVRPKFICALGGSAAQSLLQTTQSLGKLRGRFHDFKGIPVLCTYHPAFLLPHRDPSKKKDVWQDMKLLLARMGRPVPARGQG